MADIAVIQAIVFGASVLGTLTRTLLPYWDKLRADPEMIFEKKFLGTAAIALVTSAIVAATLFVPMLELAKHAGSDATLAAVFFIVFTAALGTNEMINWAIARKPPEAPPTGPTTTATPAA